jgi:adenine-specific DNA-methyltransferase
VPELVFKGKEFVYNHHLAIPYRPLIPHPEKSIGEPRLDGNLVVHGDNLLALKSLLPMYAGQVDCVFIDPPYNTGNEGWCYNDNVNSPMLREWLSSNPVGIEDGLRHDKWLAMMWPRVRLLHDLLSETGSLWMTLDDNEVHRARGILDEIFGSNCCVGQIVWQKRTSRENRAALSPSVDHIIVYSKGLSDSWRLIRNLLDSSGEGYSNPDNDPRGPWKSIPFSAQGFRKNQVYPITTPTGVLLDPPKGRCWGATKGEFEKLKSEKKVYWPKDGDGRPRIKQFPEDEKGLVPETLWMAAEVGDTEDSKKKLLEIFSDQESLDFHAPKPHELVQRIIKISTKSDSIILDSFAGTGTTAHAVLSANQKDGGHRRFILVECEDYADRLTAERVRRVINGYEFTGTQREELHREPLTWTKLKNAHKLLDQVAGIENLEEHRFDRITKAVKDGELIVTGEKSVTERTEGLGGGFTFCTLGEPIEMDKLLTGESLPSFEALGSLLYYLAANQAAPEPLPDETIAGCGYLGESAARHLWLIYRPDLDFLKSRDAALTLSRAEAIVKAKPPGKKHLVFAPAKFASRKLLQDAGLPVEFAALPFALYRIERS